IPKIIFILRIGFIYFVAREFYLSRFKEKKNKYVWFIIIAFFGCFDYLFHLAFKRRLVLKKGLNRNSILDKV
ncbi:hypothetical protein N9D26_00810, partial [bacterium]|nr:hypothetical protein [bacterium]